MTKAEFEALAADGYDCRGDETLDHDTIADCIENYLDALMQPDNDVVAVIKETGSVKVTAFRVGVVTDEWLVSQADAVLEAVAEAWGEEYGDPDGALPEEFPEVVCEQHRPALVALLRAFVATETVWSCYPVGSYEYSPAEVEAMMREHRPDWFAGAGETGAAGTTQ